MQKSVGRRSLIVLSAAMMFAGLACLTQAQVPMTGAGKGAPGGGGGGSNVTPDVVGTPKYQATSNSFSYAGLTIAGGLTSPGLVCMVARADVSNDVEAGLSLIWGAQTINLRKSQNGGTANNAVSLFGLRSPTSGNQTLAVTATNTAADNWINCVSFSNVNQTSDALAFPNPAGANTAASLNVTSAAGHIAVGVFDFGSTGGTIIGTIVINDQVNGSLVSAGADYVTSSGASTVVGTTVTQINIAGMDVSN